MSVAVVYCCPVPDAGPQHFDFAMRFVTTWLHNQPLADHRLYVVSNGGRQSTEAEALFSMIPSFETFHQWTDEGWDIGGFQSIAPGLTEDMVVFFGGNSYFHRAGWLKRMVEVYNHMGPHLFGAFGSLVYQPHIRTTGFWMPRELFIRYPHQIRNHQDRYDFEHRSKSLTAWVETQQRQPFMVTWGGVYGKQHWHRVPDAFGYPGGNHSQCLCMDRVSEIM